MAAAANLAPVKRALGGNYDGFEALCLNNDFESVKRITIGLAGMNNLSDVEITWIMAEVLKRAYVLMCFCVCLVTRNK